MSRDASIRLVEFFRGEKGEKRSNSQSKRIYETHLDTEVNYSTINACFCACLKHEARQNYEPEYATQLTTRPRQDMKLFAKLVFGERAYVQTF